MELIATTTQEVLHEIARERKAQDRKWGEQNHPDIWDETPEKVERTRIYANEIANKIRAELDSQPADWSLILLEEAFEAIAEEDPGRLREELIQVAAVATAWVEAIDRRG